MLSINEFYDIVIPRLNDVPFITYNGTLWSVIVKNKLYKDDLDIDLLFPAEVRDRLKTLFSDFTILRDDVYHLYFEFHNRRLDCYLYYDHGSYISESSSYAHLADELNIDPESISLHWDKNLIFPTYPLIFRNQTLNIPNKPELMLEEHYGKDWRLWETPEGDSTVKGIQVYRTVTDHKTEFFYKHNNTPYYWDKNGFKYSFIPVTPSSQLLKC